MNAAEKGERYARIFRKAGTLLGKNQMARALEALDEGLAIAREHGDTSMARRFEDEIARVAATSKLPEN